MVSKEAAVITVLSGAEILFAKSYESFPSGSEKVVQDLERMTAILIVVYTEVFEKLDIENPARAICGALISQQAFILQHVILWRVPKRAKVKKEKSFQQNRAIRQSHAASERILTLMKKKPLRDPGERNRCLTA